MTLFLGLNGMNKTTFRGGNSANFSFASLPDQLVMEMICSPVRADHDLEGLTLKAPIATAADDIHKYFSLFFLEKITLVVSSESSARQRIHLKKSSLIFFER